MDFPQWLLKLKDTLIELATDIKGKASLAGDNTFTGDNKFNNPVAGADAVVDEHFVTKAQLDSNAYTPTFQEVLVAGSTLTSIHNINTNSNFSITKNYTSTTNATINYGASTPRIELWLYDSFDDNGILINPASVDISAGKYVSINTETYSAKLRSNNLSASRTYDFPDASGTLALESYVDDAIDAIPHYEEGTWNANLYGYNGGSIFAGQQKFIRVGNQVTLWYDIALSSNPDYSSVLTGAVRLGGLPYTSSVDTSSAISHSHYIDYVSSNRTTLFFELQQGTSYLRMVSIGSTQPRTIIDSNNLLASSLSMIGSITYIIQS